MCGYEVFVQEVSVFVFRVFVLLLHRGRGRLYIRGSGQRDVQCSGDMLLYQGRTATIARYCEGNFSKRSPLAKYILGNLSCKLKVHTSMLQLFFPRKTHFY